SWGLPIPAFKMPDGGLLLTPASVRAVGEAFRDLGSDSWFTEPVERLLAAYDPAGDPDAPEGVDVATLVKTYDIFDVWFESGTSWNAAMRRRELGFPVDLYLEGSDQHRGWFQLSLLPSLGATGHSPFTSVLTHGFTVDKDGRKMSKSGDNALMVDDLMDRYGADVCRWWVSSLAFENDIKVDTEFFELAGETYRKVRNTLRFLLSNLADFDAAAMSVDLAGINPSSVDGYVLEALANLQGEVLAAYDRYEFRRVKEALYNFCNETLSAFYCAAVKDRLYCDDADSPRRRQAQSVVWWLAQALCKLLAPIIPHTADEAYRALWRVAGDDTSRCVHLEAVEPFEYRADPDWAQAMEQRTAALKKLEHAKTAGIENPLDAEVVIPAPKAMLSKFEADWADMLGVSRVTLVMDAEGIVVNDLSGQMRCDRCWKRDVTTIARSDGGALCDRCAEAIGLAEPA
ncbi:MAG: class I tRNA ligase family protein, partial [Phycisphaerales bacterium]